MSESTTQQRPTNRVQQIRRAALVGLDVPPDVCADCVKTGLAILPLVARPVQKSRTDALKKKDPKFASGCAKVEARLNWSAPEGAAWYFLRSAPAGYLYVFKPATKGWDAYVVGEDGMLKRCALAELPDSPEGVNLSQTCKRSGHSNERPMFFVVDPAVDKEIFVAYSPHRWTTKVRERFENDTDGCRSRMTRLDVDAAQKGQVGPKSPVEHAMTATPDALLGVADHAAADFRNKLNEHLFTGVRDREAITPSLCAAMAKASQMTVAKQGIALLITDAIGIAEDLNLMRLRVAQDHQAWMAGGPDAAVANADALRPWKRQSAVHVGYIEAWVKGQKEQEAKTGVESLKKLEKDCRDNRFAYSLLTEDEFRRRYGSLVSGPVQAKQGGLNPWAGAKWVPLDGADAGSGLGTVVKSDAYWQALVAAKANQQSTDKLARYRKRLRGDGAELDAFNTQYKAAEDAWHALAEQLDRVYVDYLDNRLSFNAVLTHDFDNEKKLQDAARDSNKTREYLQDAQARLKATERALGGAVVAAASLDYFSRALDKAPDDKTNWICMAVFKDFDWLSAAADPGTAPDLYEIGVNSPRLPKELREAWAGYKEAQDSAQGLILIMQQAINRLRIKELASAGTGAGLATKLEALAKKEVIWVRASALHEFLATTKKHYSVRVEWKIGEYLDAHVAALGAVPGFTLEERAVGARREVREQMRLARKQLEKLAKDPALQGTITVPVVIESSVSARGVKVGDDALKVVSDNALGHPSPMKALPKSLAQQLIAERGAWQRGDVAAKFKSMEVHISGLGIVFGAWEISNALEGIASKGGLQQADAVASLMSGVTGMSGGAAEIGAFWMQSSAVAGTQGTGAVLAAQVTRALRWRLGAGLLGSAGAFADMSSSIIKYRRSSKAGEIDAAREYERSSYLLGVAGLLSAGGAVAAWRAALAARAGTQVLAAIGRGLVLRTALVGLAGSWWTGVGLVLFAAGIIWAIYAQSLEHDDNERFLDRSFWGKHDGKEQYPPYGGDRGADVDMWMAAGLTEESLALAMLALGVRGTINDWDDETWVNTDSRDVITATLSFGDYKPQETKFSYSLEGLKQALPGMRGDVLYQGPQGGDLVSPTRDNPNVHELQLAFRVDDDKYKAVRLNFALLDASSGAQIAAGYAFMEND